MATVFSARRLLRGCRFGGGLVHSSMAAVTAGGAHGHAAAATAASSLAPPSLHPYPTPSPSPARATGPSHLWRPSRHAQCRAPGVIARATLGALRAPAAPTAAAAVRQYFAGHAQIRNADGQDMAQIRAGVWPQALNPEHFNPTTYTLNPIIDSSKPKP
jgi:hypothetical protein